MPPGKLSGRTCALTAGRPSLSRLFSKPPSEAFLSDLVVRGFRYDDCLAAAKLHTSPDAAAIYLEELEQRREHERLVLYLRRRGFYEPHCRKALDIWPDIMDALRFLQHQKHDRRTDGCVFCCEPERLLAVPREKLESGVKLKLT